MSQDEKNSNENKNRAYLGMDKAPLSYYTNRFGVYLCTAAFMYANYLIGILVYQSEKPVLPWDVAMAVCAVMVTYVCCLILVAVSPNEAIQLAHKGIDAYKDKN